MIWEILAEQREKEIIFTEARETATRLGKPLLNVGAGWAFPRAFNESDVNLDVVPRQVPNFVLGSVEDMSMFGDKQFGALFASHVLEHIKDIDRARREMERVSDYQFIITPSPLFITNWLQPHHQRIFKDLRGREVLFELPPKPWIA